MDDSVRWIIKVSKQTDFALRSYLAQHGMKKGDLSRFIEEAVRWRVLDRTVSEVKAGNAGIAPRRVVGAIDAALVRVRAERLRTKAA